MGAFRSHLMVRMHSLRQTQKTANTIGVDSAKTSPWSSPGLTRSLDKPGETLKLLSPFFASQKKRIFLFSCGATSSRTVPKTQPLQVAFSLRERVGLRSQKGRILGKKIAWGREGWTGQKKEKRMHKKRWVLGAVSADEGHVQSSLPVKKKPVVKNPPANLPSDLRQFLVKRTDGNDSAVNMPAADDSTRVPMGKMGTLPGIPEKKKAILKARSREPSKSRARSRGRTLEQESGAQRSRSRGDERKKSVGVAPSGYFTRVSAYTEEALEVSRQQNVTPTDFTNPCLQGDFLDWTVRDLAHSWGEGERTWFNVYVELCLHEPWHWTTCHPRLITCGNGN